MQDAKTFLARVVPWPGPGDAWWINIHSTFIGRNGKATFPGRAFKDFGRAVRHIEWLLKKPGPKDIYVCMSGQAEATPQTSKNGYTWHKAVRRAENATVFRGIWGDIDVKEGAYATPGDAIDAFSKFALAVGLPAPTFLVFSGSGGFHVHWVFEDPLEPAAWRELAQALEGAMQANGLLHDPQCTTNPVQLLRIPDTFNWKTTPPKPVLLPHAGNIYAVSRLKTALEPFFEAPRGARPGRPSGASRPAGAAQAGKFAGQRSTVFDRVRRNIGSLSAGVDQAQAPVPTIEEVAAECPWIAQVLEDGGKGLSEPLWRESLKVAYYCQDGRDVAHELSRDFDRYDEADTDVKFDRVEHDQQTGNYGWPQCQTIHSTGAAQCATCDHRGKGKSPLNFAFLKPAAAAPPQPPPANDNPQPSPQPPADDDALPKGYWRNAAGIVYTEKDDEDPSKPKIKVIVAPYPILKLRSFKPRPGADGFPVSFVTMLDHEDTGTTVVIDRSLLSDMRGLGKELGRQGFAAGRFLNSTQGLMQSFVESLRGSKKNAILTENLGWSADVDGNQTAFVFDRMKWNCKGDTPTISPDRELDNLYTPTGDLAIWREATKLITERRRPDLDMIVATSFAAPLVSLLGHQGLVVSAYSPQTGVGKTTAMRIGQAVWSNPSTTMGGLDDTPNFVNQRLGAIRNLPYFFDELKVEEQTAKFANLVFSVSQGKGKGRLNRQAQSQKVSSFSTILIAASNNSLVDYISQHTKMTTAGIYRLFEYRSTRHSGEAGLVDSTKVLTLTGALDRNYGWAGLEYAKYLGKNAGYVKDRVLAANEKLTKIYKAGHDERFWIGVMATTLLGAALANSLQLTNIDERQLAGFLEVEFERMRASGSSSATDITLPRNLRELLAAFVNGERQQTLRTDRVWTQPSRPNAAYRVIVKAAPERHQPRLTVHVAEDDKLLRISLNALNEWMGRRGLVAAAMQRQILETMPGSKILLSHIGLHTNFKQAQEKLLQLDLAHMPDFFDFD